MDTDNVEIDIAPFREDPYRAAASLATGKPPDQVSRYERNFFKSIVMCAIYGRRHLLGVAGPGMDFEAMYACQRNFTEKVLTSRGLSLDSLTDEQRTDLTREYLLSLHAELTEVLQNTDWKKHRKQPENLNPQNVAQEMIDVQKFLWGLAIIWCISEEEFCREFWRKSQLVEQRFDEEHNNE